MTSTHAIAPSTATTGKRALASLALGVVAALLTTTAAFIALGLGVLAIGLGVTAGRAGQSRTLATIGVTAAATSIYIIVLEIFVVG